MEGHQDEAKHVILSYYSLALSSSVNFSTGGSLNDMTGRNGAVSLL